MKLEDVLQWLTDETFGVQNWIWVTVATTAITLIGVAVEEQRRRQLEMLLLAR